MTALTLNNGLAAPVSLRNAWGSAANRQSTVRTFDAVSLSKTFAKASLGIGALFAVKSAAVGLASSAGSSVILAAGIGGGVATAYSAIRDYRQEHEGENRGIWAAIKGFFSFLIDNKATYAKKLMTNSGLSLLGAGFIEFGIPEAHAEELTPTTAPDLSTPEPAEIVEPLVFEEPALVESVVGDAEPSIEPAVVDVDPLEMATITSPLDTLGNMDPALFEGRAGEVLHYAQHGEDWAVKEMASYLLYADNGSPLDQKLAVELYQLVRDSDVPGIAAQVEQDLQHVERWWGVDALLGNAAPDAAVAEVPAPVVPEVEDIVVEEEPEVDAVVDAAPEAQAPAEYRVQDNDSLWDITRAHYPDLNDLETLHKVDEIAALNGLSDAGLIYPGDVLQLDTQGGAELASVVPATPEAAVEPALQDEVLTLLPGDYGACDAAVTDGALNVQCVFNEDIIKVGQSVPIDEDDFGIKMNIHYMGEQNFGIVPESAVELASADYAPANQNTDPAVDCLTSKNVNMIGLSCRFTDEVRDFQAIRVGLGEGLDQFEPKNTQFAAISYD